MSHFEDEGKKGTRVPPTDRYMNSLRTAGAYAQPYSRKVERPQDESGRSTLFVLLSEASEYAPIPVHLFKIWCRWCRKINPSINRPDILSITSTLLK